MQQRALDNSPGKILITGASGFLGSHLVSLLKFQGTQFQVFKGDILEISKMPAGFNTVIHLAAHNKPHAGKHELYKVNVDGTRSVLEYCRRAKSRLLFASTSAVYKPTKEDTLLRDDSELGPVTLYGESKLAAEGACREYSNLGVAVTSLRIFNLYGPGQKLPFLIPDLLRQTQQSDYVILRTPEAVRDFIYVEDAARAFFHALELRPEGFLALNIGTGKGTKIASILQLIRTSAIPIAEKIQSRETDYVVADVSLSSKVLKWGPRTTLKQGISRVISAFSK